LISLISTQAASAKRRAKRAIIALRSAAFIPLSFIESNAMLSWRGGLNLAIGCNWFFIASLRDDI
jgi:hypothetical protein